MPLYTSVESVSEKLSGRLQIGGLPNPFGSSPVDANLLAKVIEQTEARLNVSIASRYSLPLVLTNKNTKNVLAYYVEKGVMCELLPTHYPTSESSGDQYGRLCCKEFREYLELLEKGLFTLDGETPLTSSDGTATGFQTTYVASRITSGRELDSLNIKW
jgi:hypothetical protein